MRPLLEADLQHEPPGERAKRLLGQVRRPPRRQLRHPAPELPQLGRHLLQTECLAIDTPPEIGGGMRPLHRLRRARLHRELDHHGPVVFPVLQGQRDVRWDLGDDDCGQPPPLAHHIFDAVPPA